MSISILDIFSLGIGPSSSHTTGPMKAAYSFIKNITEKNILSPVKSIKIELYGSLALTGKGHKTDQAILLGLAGNLPETVAINAIPDFIKKVLSDKKLNLFTQKEIFFDYNTHLLWHYKNLLPFHTNGMKFTAYHENNEVLFSQIYYSIGGGFIKTENEFNETREEQKVPYPFKTTKELIQQCFTHNMPIRNIVLANETSWRSEEETKKALLKIAATMHNCIEKGLETRGTLEGGLNTKRRAADLYNNLQLKKHTLPQHTFVTGISEAFALAVAEENAAGGRIVTAPTNGAAGIVPAVLRYYQNLCNTPVTNEDILTFLLTAGAIAILFKLNASISGAEVGCQGEVGVACSMAAGALTAVLGGNNHQIQKAAEIAIEHNLGLTCDPVAGLVQIPCIERNAIATTKAISAALLALLESDSNHKVSLDTAMATMMQTGNDMHKCYKETSLAGLAVNVKIKKTEDVSTF